MPLSGHASTDAGMFTSSSRSPGTASTPADRPLENCSTTCITCEIMTLFGTTTPTCTQVRSRTSATLAMCSCCCTTIGQHCEPPCVRGHVSTTGRLLSCAAPGILVALLISFRLLQVARSHTTSCRWLYGCTDCHNSHWLMCSAAAVPSPTQSVVAVAVWVGDFGKWNLSASSNLSAVAKVCAWLQGQPLHAGLSAGCRAACFDAFVALSH